MNKVYLPSRRVLLEAVILVSVAMMAGLSLNYSMVMNAFSGRSVAVAQIPVQQSDIRMPLPVDYEELDELLAAGALLVDARDRHIYEESHLPGAISLPLGEVVLFLEDFMAKYPRSTPLIVYCNGFGCPDSFDLGVRLLAEGYQQVQVYEGGFPEWRDRGRDLESGGTP